MLYFHITQLKNNGGISPEKSGDKINRKINKADKIEVK